MINCYRTNGPRLFIFIQRKQFVLVYAREREKGSWQLNIISVVTDGAAPDTWRHSIETEIAFR